MTISILLNNIRSVHNVGSIFRTSDAVGVNTIYLSGFSPTPLDRFNQPRKDFTKCSLGSENSVSWQYVKDHLELIKNLKQDGYKIVSIEQSDKSIDYKKVSFSSDEKVLIIFGNEVEGVDLESVLESDIVAEIPMLGLKESLNVSVSAGIVLFRWFDRTLIE